MNGYVGFDSPLWCRVLTGLQEGLCPAAVLASPEEHLSFLSQVGWQGPAQLLQEAAGSGVVWDPLSSLV